jgi:hypothetical protein
MTDSAVDDGTARAAVPFITRVRLKNYKSIASCDVRLGPLTILVGPNGSDREDLDVSAIRPVAMRDGLTVIGEVDDASREIADEKLYTLGELMRGNQLSPAQHDDGQDAEA